MDTTFHAKPDSELLYNLALQLGSIQELSEAAQVTLETFARCTQAKSGLLLMPDIVPLSIGMSAPTADEVVAIYALPAVQAAMQLVGITVLPGGLVPLDGSIHIAGILPTRHGPPGLLLLGCEPPLNHSVRRTLAAAMPLLRQTFERLREQQHRQQTRPTIDPRLAQDLTQLQATLNKIHERLLHAASILYNEAMPEPEVTFALAQSLEQLQQALDLCTKMQVHEA
ncbi:hypothetical protein EYB53_009200 [Candidatus Chloroploca sp. M-50]|uniref:GAF domain-containing protein n=1 Tax=Candidatus Chloroploca mongolica TaxID=2528176 RepID=A0ABS4D8W6_9CHLR|nr:hypothetical protein [Candidatus Chloroploca mongolica]MBP1465878.1 hypothetical protein [Candidatus Chloroploca mongolica]